MTLIDKAEALAPCPFCGHRAETQEYGTRTEVWAVWCVECKAQMESISTEAEAIAAWNRRAIPARGVGVPTERPDAPAHIVEYTNWRGETARRTIIPIRMWWGSTEWHPEEQWMLTAWDVEKDAPRDFAWQDMRPVQNGATSAAVAATDATEKGGDAFEDRDSDRPNPATSPGVTAGADAAQARDAAQEHRLIAAAKEARDIAIRHAARGGARMSTILASALMLTVIFGLSAVGLNAAWTAALAAWGGYLTCLLQEWMIHTREARRE